MFNKQDVYEKEVLPLIEKARAICEKHGMSFSHTCTVQATHNETLVSKSILGNLDARNTDPYTRLNILIHNMAAEMVEYLCIRIMAEAAVVEMFYKNGGTEKSEPEEESGSEGFEMEDELLKRIEELFGGK